MNILLAEDDIQLGELIEFMLKKNNYRVDWVKSGDDAVYYALSSYYDVIVLDWMMPDSTGISVCKNLRKKGYQSAILMVTARDSVEDRIEGLDAGADDYLVKPFEITEMLARIRALARRNYAPIVEEQHFIDGMTLNRTSQTASVGEKEVQLSPKEFQLLDLFVKNKGQVLPRALILERVWGNNANVAEKTIDATVKLLRKKLIFIGKQNLLHSVRGVGYKFED